MQATEAVAEPRVQDMLCGGWSEFSGQISPEARKVFDEAIGPIMGVDYTPLAFSSQVVAGMNYCFFCNARGVYPDAANEGVVVYIYQPPSAERPQVREIRVVCPPSLK